MHHDLGILIFELKSGLKLTDQNNLEAVKENGIIFTFLAYSDHNILTLYLKSVKWQYFIQILSQPRFHQRYHNRILGARIYKRELKMGP